MVRWRSPDPSRTLHFWRSNSNNRRGGGALWENQGSNISPFPGRDPSISYNNDPVLFVCDRTVTIAAGATVRGTMDAWGSHKKFAPNTASYFTTPAQITGLEWWQEHESIDSSDLPATETVSSQVDFRSGSTSGKVYVPDTYSPDVPTGLVVFVNADDSTYLPSDYQDILDDLNMIGASPETVGNLRHDPWRIARTLDLTVSLIDEYNVDPSRVFVSGSSGGAVMAVTCALLYPDLYSGCLSNAHGFRHAGYETHGGVWPSDQFSSFATAGNGLDG